MDDVTILTFSTSIERNCLNLKKVYRKCLAWADTHGSKFNPEKSELIHFTGKRRLGNKRYASIDLEGARIEPSKSIRILEAFLDRSLSPGAQLRTIQRKALILQLALKRLTQST